MGTEKELEVASAELQEYRRLTTERSYMLERMERAGWPCSLLELPDKYRERGDLVAELVEERDKLKESNCVLVRERDELQREVKELRERLQFDPGGSDRIDELEQVLQFVRHDQTLRHNELVTIREDFERWLRVLPERRLDE